MTRVTGRRRARAGERIDGLPRLLACILDFDGVIAETEPVHAEAKRRTLERFGIVHPYTIFDDFKGRTDVDFFDHIVARLPDGGPSVASMLEDKRAEYRKLYPLVQLMPGFDALLAVVRRRFQHLAIATSATRADFDLVAGRFDFAREVDVVVTSDDTTRFKPDPEPYLVALDRLGVEPAGAATIEDSPNGVRSAALAGTFVIGLGGAFAPTELEAAGADLVVHDLLALADRLEYGP
jgi:beta-phosphoglucomutase